MRKSSYVPERGDVVWLDFDPQAGHEQAIIRQIPAGRMGCTAEIAETVAFLASEKAGFITGATISANGGQYMA